MLGLTRQVTYQIPRLSRQDHDVHAGQKQVQAAVPPVRRKPGKFRVTADDLMVAIPTDDQHIPLVEASRHWRKRIRTLIATNNTELAEQRNEAGRGINEAWQFYPDDKPLRALHPGDTRAAVAPFMAHTVFGDSYKWCLYGDDDTVWFIDGILDLVQDIDPDMPYFITDHLWWSSINNTIGNHPNLEAPRCLPCGHEPEGMIGADGWKPFNAPIGCPCTAELLCNTDDRNIFEDDCSIPRHPIRTYSMHGGAGGLVSVGLLRILGYQRMIDCVESLHSTGGDAFITICLWFHGYAHTDPGYSFYHPEMRMFDPGPEDSAGVMYALSEAVLDRCDPSCKHLVDHMVTSHVRSRKAASIEAAAQTIRLLSNAYDSYIEHRTKQTEQVAKGSKELHEQQAVVSR
ncbi:hypothetical protein WJX72_011896 [[Myrmecia] bisecta]|uniref:Uncharacterized protein n=1 Tax=[Myrmecia] bisecta TaxID=41462 RepID=A0AAW1Q8P0_9CHLO